MIQIKYISSNGNEHSLIGDNMRATSGNFHTYKWKPVTKAIGNGDKVYGFKKEAKTYETTITVRGAIEERKKILNELRDDFEHDILSVTPGKIYFGEYHIEAFVITSESKTSDIINYWSQDSVEIYCPYPFWIKETEFRFKTSDITSSNNKRYPNKYAYRYANGLTNKAITNEHIAESNFKLIIYGPVTKPRVIIGGYEYFVDVVLEEGERIEVDSTLEIVTKIMNTGLHVNCFHNRDFHNSVFRPIQSGYQSVSWTGKFDFDIILREERSEPKW